MCIRDRSKGKPLTTPVLITNHEAVISEINPNIGATVKAGSDEIFTYKLK